MNTTVRDIPRRRRYWLLVAIAAAFTAGIAMHEPIPQDARYHAFADQRTVLGVPNFWNVISNLPFLMIGIAGLRTLRSIQPLYREYAVFFVGVILVAFGSGYYHLRPDSNSLVWDRLPMTVVFMAFAAIVVGEWIDPQQGRRCLPFLLLIGVLSVIYWHVSEMRGSGDLRPYLIVQFLPLALVPLIMVMFSRASSTAYYIWGMLGAYAVAKVLEVFDECVFRALGILSGHSLKHLTAAAGAYFLVLAARASMLGFTHSNNRGPQ